MPYTCQCTDGPAAGKEFHDYGPAVTVAIAHGGHILEYHLVSILDRRCVYRFHGLAEEGAENTHERASDLS